MPDPADLDEDDVRAIADELDPDWSLVPEPLRRMAGEMVTVDGEPGVLAISPELVAGHADRRRRGVLDSPAAP